MQRPDPPAAICPECGHGDDEHEFLCERGVKEIRERVYGDVAASLPESHFIVGSPEFAPSLDGEAICELADAAQVTLDDLFIPVKPTLDWDGTV